MTKCEDSNMKFLLRVRVQKFLLKADTELVLNNNRDADVHIMNDNEALTPHVSGGARVIDKIVIEMAFIVNTMACSKAHEYTFRNLIIVRMTEYFRAIARTIVNAD